MTEQEAKNTIICKSDEYGVYGKGDLTEAFNIAISALEKQIPKEPKQIALKQGIITTNYECPVCGCRRLGHGINLDKCYCPECGQKLDWSD